MWLMQQQMIMVAHETIGVDFDARRHRHIGESGKEPISVRVCRSPAAPTSGVVTDGAALLAPDRDTDGPAVLIQR
jgi:hypothetical protein